MTQKDKELLLRDLCNRLPYNVMCQVEFKEDGKYNSKVMLLSGIFTDEAYFTTKGGSIYSNEYKPYLFSLSSMTEEEERTLDSMCNGVEMVSRLSGLKMFDKAFNWLNENHFDYRGLIEKGLAFDTTGSGIYVVPEESL